MKIIPLKNENHYRTDFAGFMSIFKSIAASTFKEWEYSNKLHNQTAEEQKSNLSLPRVLYRDFLQLSDLSLFKELKKLGRTGYFMINRKQAMTDFAFFHAQNTDQAKFGQFFNMSENNLMAKHLPKLILEDVYVQKLLYVPMLAKKLTL